MLFCHPLEGSFSVDVATAAARANVPRDVMRRFTAETVDIARRLARAQCTARTTTLNLTCAGYVATVFVNPVRGTVTLCSVDSAGHVGMPAAT